MPYTKGGRLAKDLREHELTMEKITGYRLKIVERAGEKLENILHKSNPWSGVDCNRDNCLLCTTKLRTEENKDQSSNKRSTNYQPWCESCRRKSWRKEKWRKTPGKRLVYTHI